MPIPVHVDQHLLWSRHTADDHDRAPLRSQQRPGGRKQQRPRSAPAERGHGVTNEMDTATVKGSPDGGAFDRREWLRRWLGTGVGVPFGDWLLAALDSDRQDGIAIHHRDVRVTVGHKPKRSGHSLNGLPWVGGGRAGTTLCIVRPSEGATG
jgi:hypothetical protein